MTLESGRILAHYELVGKIGEGGMGEVYRARDTTLGREVALKVLPASMANDEQRLARFRREARVVAALNHPGIVTIYSVEEADGVHFLTMELVEGQSIDRLVRPEGLPFERLLEIAEAITDSLVAAHDKDIVHRDLKPANVMLAGDGRLKVLDFGLAKELGAAGPDSATQAWAGQTEAGMVMGTPAYMSPEQVQGQELDPRTDLFSLGVLLYELASGERPFQGGSAIGLASAILRDRPRPLDERRTDLPASLMRLIERCLEKRPEDRFASAREVREELEAVSTANSGETMATPVRATASASTRRDEGFWIAVLPFRASGPHPELEALAEGLTEEIVTGMSRFSYLRVIAKSSTSHFAGKAQDVREMGRVLGARFVMEGSLRGAGRQLRFAVQLIDASTGAHLWAETYDRAFEPEGLFALLDDLVPRVVSTCADHFGVLAQVISEAVRSQPLAELTPYEALMRGFGYHLRLDSEEHAIARDALERAVELAPANADCWAMLSWVYSHEFAHGFNPRPSSLQRALEAATRAVDLAPSNHLAQQALGVVRFFLKDKAGCLIAAERALALNPLDGSNEAIFLITFTGDWERGCRLIRWAMEQNPRHPGWYRLILAFDAYRRSRYQEALQEIVAANLPKSFWGSLIFAATLGQLGRKQEAARALADLLGASNEFDDAGRSILEKWFEAELVEHLMAGLRLAGHQGEPAGGKPSSEPERREAPTVGRKAELDQLQTALEAARGGRGCLLCVAGEPGIGKTTLVEGFLAQAEEGGELVVARGRSSERLAGSEAYLPVLEALDDLIRGPSGRSIAQTLQRVAPVWLAQLTLSSDVTGSPSLEVQDASQERLKREFVAAVQELSSLHPLILFFDDLHWADVSTVDLLGFLASKFEGLKVLVITTYRPSDLLLAGHAFLKIKPDLQARSLCRELSLEFLEEGEIADFLELRFPGHAFPSELVALIHAKTEGSPLFMADLVRDLTDRGTLGEQAGIWRLTQELPDLEQQLPQTVRAMIERKIGQLGESERKLLEVASVQGYDFDSAVVAEVLGLSADEVEEQLEKLERVHAFVELGSETEFPDRTLTLRYSFVHALYQNALYGSLRATRRSRLSRQVGEQLEAFHGGKTQAVAHELAALFETGRDFARAARYYLRAAEHASQVFADREAATLASQGIASTEMLDASEDRAGLELELQCALGLALRSSKGYGHADTGKAYRRARELCHEIGDAPLLFPVLFGLWEFFQNQGQLDAAVDVGEQMLELAEEGDDSGHLVAAHSVMADNLLTTGHPEESRQHGERAIELYDVEQHRGLLSLFGYDPGVAAHSMRALALWFAGYPEQALASYRSAMELSDRFEQPSTLAFPSIFGSWVERLCGNFTEAQKAADRSVQLTPDIPAFRSFGFILQAWAGVSRSELEAASGLVAAGLQGLQDAGFAWGRPFTLCVAAEVSAAGGKHDEALAFLEEALEHARQSGEHLQDAEIHRIRGEILQRSGTSEATSRAERCFLRALEVAEAQKARSLELRAATRLARLWLELGRRAEARERLESAYSWFTEGKESADLRAAETLLSELGADS